jgi:hypothetical protein
MNITFGNTWVEGFKPQHHKLVTLGEGRRQQTFVQLPLEGRTLLLHPFEGAVPPEYVNYAYHHSLHPADTVLLENDRTESILHLKGHPLDDNKMQDYRYYKRFIQQTTVEPVTPENYMELTCQLYAHNMERFQFTLPKYPYWFDGEKCPVNRFYLQELEQDTQFKVDSIWHLGKLLAIRFYYDMPGQVFWARTLRTFDPEYASWKVGTAATVALIASTYEKYGSEKEVHLGLEMEYKPRTFKSCKAWDYEARLGCNLALKETQDVR